MKIRYASEYSPLEKVAFNILNKAVQDNPTPVRLGICDFFAVRYCFQFNLTEIELALKIFAQEFSFQTPIVQSALSRLVRDGVLYSKVVRGVRYYGIKFE